MSGNTDGGQGGAAGDGAGGRRRIRRALVSVSDKTGLVELGAALREAGVEIVSTGSTAATLRGAGVDVVEVAEVTGFAECLDGRVKTLHPRVHAGLLADLRRPDHVAELADLGIEPFDLLVVNLYPFVRTVASGAGFDEAVEQIDIGGPAMVRAAAKNHASVAVVVDPGQYPNLVAALAAGGFDLAQRRELAAAAFAHTAGYDAAVASWFAGQLARGAAGDGVTGDASADDGSADDGGGAGGWPGFVAVTLRLDTPLRYGENPHQAAALYRRDGEAAGLAQARLLHGKAMSYNNYVDADVAWRAVHDVAEPCVAVIKHANPCGIAVGADAAQAHRRAHACDPVSAFGGVIASNRAVDATLAAQIAEIFTEVVVAPAFDDDAVRLLAARKNLRLLLAPPWTPAPVELRPISGGVLVQAADRIDAAGDDPAAWTLVSGAAADAATLADCAFAWRAARGVRSNAILLARDGATVGVGMGQVNRVDAARLAVARAGDRATGSVAASDAFFPFPDGLAVLLDAGVRAVVQPGGSVRDAEVIEAARQRGVTMYLTGTRHFCH